MGVVESGIGGQCRTEGGLGRRRLPGIAQGGT